MSENDVRDQLQRYVEDVTPVQVPPFAAVSQRRRRRRLRRTVAGTSFTALVAAVVVVAAIVGGSGGDDVTATPTATPSTTPGGPSLLTAAGLSKALVGSSWRLVSVHGPATYWRARPESKATLAFTATDFLATDGCDSVQSHVAFGDQATLTFGGKDGQGIACSLAAPGPPIGATPPRLFEDALQGEFAADITDGVLTLTHGSTVLILTSGNATYVDPNAGDKLQALLTSHTWPLHLISSAGKRWGDPQKAVMQFGAHGWTIDPDCNAHSGSISYAAGNLVMQFFMETAMGCPADETVQRRSAEVIDALFSGPVSVEEDAGLLMLWNDTTSLELHQGPAPAHELGIDLPPPSAPAATPAASPASSSGAVSSAPTVAGASSELLGQLAGVHWLVESWQDKGGDGQGDAGARGPYISFAATGVIASDGCNSHYAPATYEGSRVTTTESMGATAVDCTGPSSQVQKVYRDLFAHPVALYVFDDGQRLTLSGDNVSLSLHRDTRVALPPAARALMGRQWRLQSVEAPGVHWQAKPTTNATLLFTAFTYNVSDGCESHEGDLAVDAAGATLTLGAPWSMGECSMASPAPGSFPPDNYLAGFTGKVSAVLAGGTLTLTHGGVVLHFS